MTDSALAFAKLNISLDIVSKMSDGYHNMRMIMQTVSLSDEITIKCVLGEGVSVETGVPYIPGDERNIAAKAALAFFRHTGISGYRTKITIKKNIPVCAGLGGGSTDGACVLRMLDKMFGLGLGRETLEAIGLGVGADVPFCIAGGTSLAEGRGEILTDLPSLPRCHIVICKPPFASSTPVLFKRIKCDKIRARPDTDGIVEALNNGDLNAIARRMYNVFEDVLPRGVRDVADIKYEMLDNGALGAVMTGSGAAVFGLFDDGDAAKRAYEHLSESYKECYLTDTIERLEILKQ
jgi:4-diphosphocytidyl-2-C-methyl-D-erythritol kinase